MKNYIKKFNSFVNEMAKGDYFQLTGPDKRIYGLHHGGSSDWMRPGSPDWQEKTDSEPDEEMGVEDFISKHGENLPGYETERLRRSSSPEDRIRIWKKAEREQANQFANLTNGEIMQAIGDIEKRLAKVSDEKSPELNRKMNELLPQLRAELESRGGTDIIKQEKPKPKPEPTGPRSISELSDSELEKTIAKFENYLDSYSGEETDLTRKITSLLQELNAERDSR
jgi:hypothetical protein